MDDLTLCKRIAEIEGVIYSNFSLSLTDYEMEKRERNGSSLSYNPLTDDALCFQLMVKYEVDVQFNDEWCGINMDYETKGVSFEDIPVNRAILLAIIEAHSD